MQLEKAEVKLTDRLLYIVTNLGELNNETRSPLQIKFGPTLINLLPEVKEILKELEQTGFTNLQARSSRYSVPAMRQAYEESTNRSRFQSFCSSNWWLDHMNKLARQYRAGWISHQQHELFGIDLTGEWIDLNSDCQQSVFVRQTGVLVDWMECERNTPQLYAQGLVNPQNWNIYLAGWKLSGLGYEGQLKLDCNWHLTGKSLFTDWSGQQQGETIKLVKNFL